MKPNTKHIILTFIILIIIIIGICFCNKYLYNASFTEYKWKNHPENRIEMLDALIAKHKLIGLNRNEIIDLLGEDSILMNNKDMIEYFISPGIGDVVGFIIFFDENDVAFKYKKSIH